MIGRRPNSGGISCRKVRRFFKEGQSLQSSNRRAYRRESDRTLRDGSFEVALSRHFVPGYYRAVPPGQNHSPIEAPRIIPTRLWVETPGFGLPIFDLPKFISFNFARGSLPVMFNHEHKNSST
jgi:hypothetical protein